MECNLLALCPATHLQRDKFYAGDADIFTVVKNDEIAAITASGTATVNITWLEG